MKSCVTNFLECVYVIKDAIHQGYFVDLIFLDFTKAFNIEWHIALLQKLYSYGEILAWLESFLSNRRQRVVIGDLVYDWKPVLSGVPQGSV